MHTFTDSNFYLTQPWHLRMDIMYSTRILLFSLRCIHVTSDIWQQIRYSVFHVIEVNEFLFFYPAVTSLIWCVLLFSRYRKFHVQTTMDPVCNGNTENAKSNYSKARSMLDANTVNELSKTDRNTLHPHNINVSKE